MTQQHKVGILVGSLRKESFNRKVAQTAIEVAPASLTLSFIEYGDMPLYVQDMDANPPPPFTRLRNEVRASDTILFVTPEYNRSVPGVLKNAIDIASRPYGQSAWSRKPAAVISVSPGAIGAFGANHHLRQSLVFLDMPVMQQPEAYIGGADKLFDASGKMTNDSTRGFLEKFMQAFAGWIDRTAG